MPNINTILERHTTLKVECIDRIYLQGYVPSLQRPNQLALFLKDHRRNPVPSPALLGQMPHQSSMQSSALLIAAFVSVTPV